MRGVGGEFGAAIFGQLTLDPVDKAAVGEMADYRQARGDAIGRHAPRDAKHRRAVDEVIAAPHRHADMRGTRLVAGAKGPYEEDAAHRIFDAALDLPLRPAVLRQPRIHLPPQHTAP